MLCHSLQFVAVFLCVSITNGLGGEKAFFQTTPATPDLVSHRQDVCDRFEKHRAGEIGLRNALSGLSLRPAVIHVEGNPFFKYSADEGIDTKNPGIEAELMDAVAERANFTWRNSFALTDPPSSYNMTWTELLLWIVENYDLSMGHFDHTVERMEGGVTFPEPWYDDSMILIDRQRSLRETNDVDPLNWTKPFEPAVWGMIVLTVVLSGLVYQFIEHLSGEREDRSLYQWFSDNLYLSAINFSQNFEYAPSSLAGRLFGVSMTIWALVITATYTANLASLFVESRVEPVLVNSMEEAVVYGYPVCTYENTNADFFIRETFPNAQRVPGEDDKVSFTSLRNGECALAVTSVDSWLTYQVNEEYNPDCDLEWVGEKIKTIKAGFAMKADVGHKCSGLIRHVINLHLIELHDDGVVEELWRKHRERLDDGMCAYENDEESDRRRLLHKTQQAVSHSTRPVHRRLKGGGRASSSTEDGVDADTLTLQQMAGTFIFHYGGMAVALLVSLIAAYAEKLKCFHSEGKVYEKVTNRTHGPVIGLPPPVNTYVVRDAKEECALDTNAGDSENISGQQNKPVGSGDEISHPEMVAKQQALEAKLDSVQSTMNAKMNAMQMALDVQTDMIRQLLKGPYNEHFA
ncbi:receptor ionotropic, NMDA 1 [Seminavis robusta]|uniref:Receptor ionotropic, NMDA 1 n=1 Tax=Seminavis robusta TaxID=568900 RepID=A0A9N8ERV7_9STRA|nr:receptor ionotropic, NMDA 1 [Seminavis robusta]|eukprot:Sro1777_g296940.1 receptor ionotropic, NMDA 1 (632) ;mRNA; f:16187-18082